MLCPPQKLTMTLKRFLMSLIVHMLIFIVGPRFHPILERVVNEHVNYGLSSHYAYLSMVSLMSYTTTMYQKKIQYRGFLILFML